MGVLTTRQRQVVRLKYGLGDDDPMTYKQIGGMQEPRFGTSVESIRQVHDQALGKLRKHAADVLDGAPLSPESLSPKKRSEPVDHPIHEYASVVELLLAKPRALRALRQVRDRVVRDFPGRGRMVVRMSGTARNKIDLEVRLRGLEEGRGEGQSVGVESQLRFEIYYQHASDSVRVRVVAQPAQRSRLGLGKRLESDAVEGGFIVLGRRGRNNVRLAVGEGRDVRAEVLLMRLWFCDRANLVSIADSEVQWAPTKVAWG